MARLAFPRESSQMASIQARIPTASLGEVHQAVEELTNLSHKAGRIAHRVFESGLFEAAIQRTNELNDQEIELNHQISDLRRDLGDLGIAMVRLSPLKIALRLDEIQQKIMSCPQPSTQNLQQQLHEVQDQWQHLLFLYAFPDAEELNKDSFQSNLVHRVNQKVAELQKSDPKKAAQLMEAVSGLQKQSDAAEAVFNGQGLGLYLQLPKEVQLAVEQRFFERFPGESLSNPSIENREHVAGAIMAVLADEMMKVQI